MNAIRPVTLRPRTRALLQRPVRSVARARGRGELGGTAALRVCETLLCGESRKNRQEPHAGSNRGAAPLPLNFVRWTLTLCVSARRVGAARPVGCHTALGVFFRFQVTDFDLRFGFFSLCHFIFPSYLFGLFCRCGVSVTPKGN